jgi:TPP-dependent 2-oxoacid decarboxylase
MNEVFNDIQPWHFKELVNVFGAKEGEPRTYQVKMKEQTKKLFDDKEFNSATNLQFVELYAKAGYAKSVDVDRGYECEDQCQTMIIEFEVWSMWRLLD